MSDIETLRHSASHILAAAVKKLFPDVKLGIGPAVENGFYYDFEKKTPFTPEDLVKIEKAMQHIVKQNVKFEKIDVDFSEAKKMLKNEPYKLELLEELKSKGEKITFYKSGDFVDLCKGPHAESTGKIKALKLTKMSSAYWKGNEKNAALQRIYGVAFEAREELDAYVKMIEEAEKRDHKKLGRELGLFVFSDLVGPGLPLYTPRGAILRYAIQNYSRELRRKIGYQEVYTPQINKAELFKISGHYDKYKGNMFRVVSNYTEEEYYLKPMNCPQHTQIFASRTRSYRDLPVRVSDFANLYRDEKPGELSGLTRLRCFCQDDGHCFCTEDQIGAEFNAVLSAISEAMKTYGMEYYIRLSLRDEKKKEEYLGDDAVWQKSEKMLEDMLKEMKIKYVRAEGEAAFYGPKMDLIAKDCLGREWQLSTVQLDFNMPKRFGLEYVGSDDKKHIPVMIHSAIVGSPDRFLGVLIEHYAGKFPLWLSPVQVKVLTVNDRNVNFAREILSKLTSEGLRAELDDRSETIGRKVRDAQMEKVNYILTIGDKEVEVKTLAVRTREGKVEFGVSAEKFIADLKKEIAERK